MRFYLDESLSEQIAVNARRLGVDVTSSHALGNDGQPDDFQLSYATREGRCIVTTNYDHFVGLSRSYADLARHHAGILLLSHSFKPSRHSFGAIARALQQFSEEHPEALYELVDWLRTTPGV